MPRKQLMLLYKVSDPLVVDSLGDDIADVVES